MTLLSSLHLRRAPAPPTQVHVSITERCCLPCTMCDIWKRPPGEELSTTEWTGVFDQVAAWAGPVGLNFSGGEPLMRRDLPALVQHGASLGFTVTTNTNGVLLTEELAVQLEDAGLEELFVSLDGVRAETHERLRPRAGTFRRVQRALDILERRQRLQTIIAAVLHRHNLDEIPDLLTMAEQRDFRLILQPLFHPFGRPYDPGWAAQSELLPTAADLPRLDDLIEQLVAVRRRGGPLSNPVAQLQAFRGYFRAPAGRSEAMCHAGHTDLSLDPAGNALLCFWLPPVGNALSAPLPWLWNHPRAMRRRWEIAHCRRTCSVLNCNYERAEAGAPEP